MRSWRGGKPDTESRFYDAMNKWGYTHGPTFESRSRDDWIWRTPDNSTRKYNVRTVSTSMPRLLSPLNGHDLKVDSFVIREPELIETKEARWFGLIDPVIEATGRMVDRPTFVVPVNPHLPLNAAPAARTRFKGPRNWGPVLEKVQGRPAGTPMPKALKR
jgi:hypothetical protein